MAIRPLRLLCTLSAAGFAFAAAPASALQQGSQETFVDLGRWVIVQDEATRSCEMRLTADPQVVLRYRMSDCRAGVMALQRRSGRFFTGMVGDVIWSFDERRFAGSQSGNGYSLSAASRDVEAGFRAAKVLTVSQGGQQVARINLKTSSAGFRLLKQCAQQWRYIPWYRRQASAQYRELPDVARSENGRLTAGPSRPVPHSGARSRPGGVAPPLEAPRSGAPALATPIAARAINPSGWITNSDNLPWPSRGFREGQGVLRYTLLVNEEGRAEDCDVEASTGSRKFDRRACKLLEERARFEPARGSNGQPVETRFTASVRFAGE